MKKLIFAILAISVSSLAGVIVWDDFGLRQWPPPRDIGILWGAPFNVACAAAMLSLVYAWLSFHRPRKLAHCVLSILALCIAGTSLGLVFYYPIAYRRDSSRHGAEIRAELHRHMKELNAELQNSPQPQ